MSESPNEQGSPPPAEPEPMYPPPDNTWVTMELIEKSDNTSGTEHRER